MIFAIFSGLGFIAATIGLTLAAYFAMRFVTRHDPDTVTRDLASSVIFRIAALHGLILALVFAQEMIEYQQLKLEGALEANAVADVYFDAGRYHSDDEIRQTIQRSLSDYVGLVVSSEWEHLGRTGRLAGDAWARWDEAYSATLDLTPANERQKSLRDHMLEKLHLISETRVKRENHGSDSISAMFWFAAISGVILIALAYYIYPPTATNLTLLGLYGAFTGIVLYFIYAFSNPFSPPGALEPLAYEKLQEQIRASVAQEAAAPKGAT